MKQFKLMLGDNMKSLKELPDNSIDSIVSDPPYGLSFMGKKWDYDVPSIELWKEVYRVLKPGGHVLSFGGTRTYHRMVVNIEDAGFEIRDQIMWIYGSGFPKSHNIGKAVDKIQGNDRESKGIVKGVGTNNTQSMNNGGVKQEFNPEYEFTKGTSPYEGWGTALKPANEPICIARKPLSEKTIADNVLRWGTGGINIDGCRIGTEGGTICNNRDNNGSCLGHNDGGLNQNTSTKHKNINDINEGRFPANIIFDESAAEMLDEQSNVSRFFYIPKVSKSERNMGLDEFSEKEIHMINQLDDRKRPDGTIRETPVHKNIHPTLKPVQLMAYLCRLVTPVGGTILDPFMGSGSTGISACVEGFNFIGMEMNEEYFKIAEARIESFEMYRPFVEKKTKKK